VYSAIDREVQAGAVWWAASNRVQCVGGHIQHTFALAVEASRLTKGPSWPFSAVRERPLRSITTGSNGSSAAAEILIRSWRSRAGFEIG
jgi:hypothetical protein